MLNRPYPLSEITSRTFVGIVLAGIFVAAFLLVFQPFGIYYWHTDFKNLKIAGYGLVTILVLWTDFYLIRKRLPTFFHERDWKVWKEIAWTIFILLSVTFGNYLYNVVVLRSAAFRLTDFAIALFTTFSIGIFPTLGFVLANYIVQLRKYSQPITVHPPPVIPTPDETVTFVAENEKERLVLPSADLIFIESTDNYCMVHYLKNGSVARELIRSSLTRLESQITDPQVMRCHRSYLVNLSAVQRVSGNAQGYKLHFEHWPEPVPVARKYSQLIASHWREAS